MKKLLPWLIIVLVAITLIAVATFMLWHYVVEDRMNIPNDPSLQAQASVQNERANKLSANEISDLTVKMDRIMTNLSDIEYMVQISFAFQLSNKKTKEEFEALSHLAQSAVIRILADTKPEEIQGSGGHDELISKLMNAINPILKKGKVSKIDITDFIINRL